MVKNAARWSKCRRFVGTDWRLDTDRRQGGVNATFQMLEMFYIFQICAVIGQITEALYQRPSVHFSSKRQQCKSQNGIWWHLTRGRVAPKWNMMTLTRSYEVELEPGSINSHVKINPDANHFRVGSFRFQEWFVADVLSRARLKPPIGGIQEFSI